MLNLGESGLFGGLIRIDYEVGSEKVMLKPYMRHDWSYFRMPTTDAGEFVKEYVGRERSQPPHLTPPYLNGKDDPRYRLFSEPMIACSITVNGREPAEISFSDGIGWISFHLAKSTHKAELKIYTPAGIRVTTRKCLLP
jgi:hypothetical protein